LIKGTGTVEEEGIIKTRRIIQRSRVVEKERSLREEDQLKEQGFAEKNRMVEVKDRQSRQKSFDRRLGDDMIRSR